jgi:hypothetical protein
MSYDNRRVIVPTLNAGVHGGHSIVSVTETEKDDTVDAVVAVWPARWYFGVAIAYSLVMVWLPMIAAYCALIYALITIELPPAQTRFFYLGIACWPISVFLGVQFERQKWRVLWKPLVSIFPDRIVVRGKVLPWDGIGSSRWSAYSHRTLVIQFALNGAYGRMSVPIPDDRRAVIEEIFRAFGKWDQPVRIDAVSQESGMGIKLGV